MIPITEQQLHRHTILIADDSEMNRSILADMLEESYDILEAENGLQAVELMQAHGARISLLLLDIVMPEMDGFGVLAEMNQRGWIEEIPVIMISSESKAAYIEKAYELGVTDFISRPFDMYIVHRRVVNTILLYAKQRKLTELVAEQIYEKEKQSSMMIDILSHIVEFRNGESGMHVRRVHTLTRLLLEHLPEKTDRYPLTHAQTATICVASALHDIGKIAVPEQVLNKPGRLTDEEYEIMKTHSSVGAQMLANLPIFQNEPLVKTAYEICRWHHERYDGRGYPDGLKGDEIPISAQIVALADVYDALTSDRVYKKAFDHDVAIRMILDGQCGAFNPLLLECLSDMAPTLPEQLAHDDLVGVDRAQLHTATEEILQREEPSASERTLHLLEQERMKYEFFAALSEEIQFEYTCSPAGLKLSPFGADRLGCPEVIRDPLQSETVLRIVDEADLRAFSDMLRSTSPGHPEVTFDCRLTVGGEKRWFRVLSRAVWSADEPPRYEGAIGKATDIQDSRDQLDALERRASSDPLTGLLNHATARQRIITRLSERPGGKFALVIFDLDHFKSANDTWGHLFGDQVLMETAQKLRRSIRGGDIVARVGGDEFLLFLEYKKELRPIIQRIFTALGGTVQDFPVLLSMGVAQTDLVGKDYETLFHAADNALYAVKRSGRGHFRFYDPSMDATLSTLSSIESQAEREKEQEAL